MKTALAVLLGLAIAVSVAWYRWFPASEIFMMRVPGAGTLALSRTGVSYEPGPDPHSTNGMSHVGAYLAKLAVPTPGFKALSLFSPDEQRGCMLTARGGKVSVMFTVEWKTKPETEAANRAFFRTRGIAPSKDYLARNGSDPDATRLLEYPLKGNTTELTGITQGILQELCGISPSEALNISYQEN